MGGPAESSRSRSGVGRVFDVLDVFGHGESLTLSEMSRRSGLPLSTTHRLAGDLTGVGALEREPSGAYHVGLRLWEIATRAPRGVGLREVALPFMEDLYESTHENVQLGVRDGLDVVFVERIAGRRAVNVLTQVGMRFPLHASGLGLVLLAHAETTVQDEILRSPLESFTEFTIADTRRLRAVLAEVRRTGFAVSDRQVTADAVSIAAAVRNARDEVVAAVSIVVPYAGSKPNLLAPAVVAAGRGITHALRVSGLLGDVSRD